MKKFNTLFVMAVLLVLLSVSSFAFVQLEWSTHPFVLQLQQQLSQWSGQQRAEKIYVQIDKTSYQPGEVIWYKLYLRDANQLQTKELSEIVYVELLSPKGTVITTNTQLALDGNAAGSFAISAKLASGRYKLKAYTNWMKNTETLFEKDILVQKAVLPNLNRKLEFERKAYGPGAEVVANLNLTSLANAPVRYLPLDLTISLAGKVLATQTDTTDFSGEAALQFRLPEELEISDGLLTVSFDYQGQRESISRSIPIVLQNIELKFFAEGGDLIMGQQNRIAFKAWNEFGKPSDVEGSIFDEKDQLITNFSSYHQGMGSFDFLPKTSNHYYAKITKPKGIKERYSLPKILPAGLTLQVADTNSEGLVFKVQSSEKSTVHLVAQAGDRILFSKSLTVNARTEIEVPIADFPMGITRFTLFDAAQQARCERLVFLHPQRKLQVDLALDKKQYLPREKLSLEISVKDEAGLPVQGNFSVSVADDKLLDFVDDKQANILASLLLESELKGVIEEPNFYFDATETKAVLALDFLMMTHGWRRFSWEKVQAGASLANVKFPLEQAIVCGKVVNDQLEPVANALVELNQPTQVVKTDAMGNFKLQQVDLSQESKSVEVKADGYQLAKSNIRNFADTVLVVLGNENGMLEGLVMDAKENPLIGCKVEVTDSQGRSWFMYTQATGAYAFHQLAGGIYEMKVSQVNYQTNLVKGIQIGAGKKLRIDLNIKAKEQGNSILAVKRFESTSGMLITSNASNQLPEATITPSTKGKKESFPAQSFLGAEMLMDDGVLLDEIVVTNYKIPLIQQDNTTSGAIIRSEEIRNLPVRNINSIAAKAVGITSTDDGEVLNIKGARTGSTYFIDGIRISSNLIPMSEIDQLQVLTGGVDASFGGGEALVMQPTFRSGKLSGPASNFVPTYEQATGKRMGELDAGSMVIRGSIAESSKSISHRNRGQRQVVSIPKKVYTLVEEAPRFYDKSCEVLEDPAARMACAQEKLSAHLQHFFGQRGGHRRQNKGQAVFQFFVNKKGEIGYPRLHIDHSAGNYFRNWQYNQAIRKMPKWVPAKNNGKKVACWYTIPFDLGQIIRPEPTIYQQVRQFYVPPVKRIKAARNARKDYRTTIHWAPMVTTDAKGKAQLNFWNNDAVSSFRITLEGLSQQGKIAYATEKYFTQLPISMQVKAPFSALQGDRFQLPISLTNHTEKVVQGRLSLVLPPQFELMEDFPKSVVVLAKESKTIFVKIGLTGDQKYFQSGYNQTIVVRYATAEQDETFQTKIKSYEYGYPNYQTLTGTELENHFKLKVENSIPGTVKLGLKAYPNRLGEVVATLDKMLRQPNGCFEQTSSTTYPNILAYNLLKKKKLNHRKIEQQALEYIQKGKERLLGFEVRSGGFDWYGKGPAHEGLTAYGLMEFVDMQRVIKVDPHLIQRTANWLLERRDGTGSWNRYRKGSFGNSKPHLGDAYIVWAMCEAGFGAEISKEIDKSYQRALATKDNYLLALMANALYLMKDERATTLMNILLEQRAAGGYWMGKEGTISSNSIRYAATETTALVALALMKAQTAPSVLLDQTVDYLLKQKNRFGFGSTQSTILVLKALVAYSSNFEPAIEPGEMKIYAGAELIGRYFYSSNNLEAIVIDSLSKYALNGEEDFAVVFENTKKAIPFELELKYQSLKPLAPKDCKVNLTTELQMDRLRMGETTRLKVTLSNTTQDTLGNAMAEIGIPAGLSLQSWQLKEIQDKAMADYYELFDGKLVLHFINLMPAAIKKIGLDLKADIPGTYNAYASSAYLYYDNEAVYWTATKGVSIVP
ncbi:MAG: carboxypeptidase regulatory-like domain-containing protein [Saprospiraceae bacterium]